MQWLVTNWFWVLIGIAFVAMHVFGHGGHAGHGGRGGSEGSPARDAGDPDETTGRGVNRSLSQAQRVYFSAHTYQRSDRPDTAFLHSDCSALIAAANRGKV